MTNAVLCINSGSSSVKFSLYTVPFSNSLGALLCRGLVENKDHTLRFVAQDANGKKLADETRSNGHPLTHEHLLRCALDWIDLYSAGLTLIAAGHRVVHGGDYFADAIRITPAVMELLEKLVPLAPLHQPYNLAGIRALSASRQAFPQVACFDTAFHMTQPKVARQFALPRKITASGILRYGFHGLSYSYIASVLPDYLGQRADDRVIVAHLGNGASLCAIRHRKSVATTMGFTALDGLMMGTRCGNVDPGVLLYLQKEHKIDVDTLADLLYYRSGLLGVSEISSDMRTLLDSKDPRAKEALELFCYRINRELGSMAAALDGLDALVFTGGIGEHAVEIRRRICESARWLGVKLASGNNDRGEACISAPDSSVGVWVIPTDEEYVVACETLKSLNEETLIDESTI